MYQRVTNNYLNQSVLNNLYTNRSALVDLQRQIASGKKFERASDDVLSSITVISSNSSLGKIEGYIKNIETAKLEVETADKAILSSLDSVHKARELTIQSLNATSGTEELNMMASQVEQIIEQIKDLGNTKYGSKHIFGGKETTSPPFIDPPDPPVTDGEGIYYAGSASGSHQREVEISEGVTITINLCGEDIFGQYYKWDHDSNPLTDKVAVSGGLIGTLSKIKEQMESSSPDKDIIRQELANLDNDLTNLLSSQATLGSLTSRLEIAKKIHADDKIAITDKKADAESIDFAKAISDLKFQESALQASLLVGAQIIKPSLLNYI